MIEKTTVSGNVINIDAARSIFVGTDGVDFFVRILNIENPVPNLDFRISREATESLHQLLGVAMEEADE